jgi:hypothetical protein
MSLSNVTSSAKKVHGNRHSLKLQVVPTWKEAIDHNIQVSLYGKRSKEKQLQFYQCSRKTKKALSKSILNPSIVIRKERQREAITILSVL